MDPTATSNPEHNPVRRSSSHASHPQSIASSRTQRTDIFSDEFAVDRADIGEMTPADTGMERLAPGNPSQPPNPTRRDSQSQPQIPIINTTNDEESSPVTPSSKERRADGPSSSRPTSTILLQQDAEPRRSLSVSSQFSIPRAPSPYNGPTAPSQPYAMYPQVTRASSVASGSTVRPVERPFVPQGGPEHPYAMYQNAVPEEDDDEADGSENPAAGSVLGAGGVASSFAGGSSSSGNDTGDIVGRDGHIEQLPPYTRYADNVVAKGDMAQINSGGSMPVAMPAEQASPSLTDASLLSPNQSSSEAEINPTTSTSSEEEQEIARKEGLYERSKRRKCCGIPVIIVVLLVIVIIVSAAVGGVVGGIVGNRKGVDHAKAESATTTTMWLDADPVETGPSTPPCPTGHFSSIPFDAIEDINQCVGNPGLQETWDCLPQANLGVTILPERDSGEYSITFDDYSNVPRRFAYGPQPPDFNGTKFALEPVEDRDNRDYGVAMFFSYLFDKIVILPEGDLNPQDFDKRDGSKPQISRRSNYSGYLREGDNPWYCYWNQTVEEFWIFLEQDLNSSSSTTANVSAAAAMAMSSTSYGGPGSTATPSTPQTSSLPSPTSGSSPTAAAQAMYAEVVYENPPAEPTPSDWYGPRYQRVRRATPTSESRGTYPTFPNMIKMIEKRKPFGNIEPYCQQMVVLDDFVGIVPKEGGAIINIEEKEFNDNPYSSPSSDDETNIIGDLESLCVCEWRYPQT